MLSRPPGFTYNHAELRCERMPLRGLAEKFGTPLYVYSAAALKQRYQAFDRAFSDTPHTICYSVKANSNLSLLRLLARMSAAELELLAECAARLKKTAGVALRVNPDVPAETHPYISTGLREHKFGVPMTGSRRLYAQASGIRSLSIAGVSVHIGSQITDVKPFGEAMVRVAELVRQLRADGHQIDFVDAGGGLGIAYDDRNLHDFGDY